MSLLKYIILKVIGCFIGMAIGTLVMGGVVWLFCWCFNLAFSWKTAVAVYLVWLFLTELFKMARSD